MKVKYIILFFVVVFAILEISKISNYEYERHMACDVYGREYDYKNIKCEEER